MRKLQNFWLMLLARNGFIRDVALAVVALSWFVPASPASLGPALPLHLLRTAREIRSITADEAKREYPVSLEGVVTFVDFEREMLFVQDNTAGIYIFLKTSRYTGLLATGRRVRVSGVTTPGEFSPCINKAEIRVIDTGTLPTATKLPYSRLITGVQDGQWSEIEGVVRSGNIRKERLILSVLMPGGRSTVTLQRYPPDWADRFVDSTIAAVGVMATRFNTHRQIIGLSLFVPDPAYLRMISVPPARPFDTPRVEIAKLGQFFVVSKWDHRVRVRGTVTGVDLDESLFISDGRDNLYVRTPQSCTARAGDLVDVVGFAGTENRPVLDEAICRTVSSNQHVPPLAMKMADLLARDWGVESPFDMALIRIEGELLEMTSGPRSTTFLLKAGNEIFTAVLPLAGGRPPESLASGSVLRLTGVCVTVFNNFQQATAFRVLLRNSRDIEVTRHPSWWTLSRAMAGLALMVFACFASLAWISILRRRVAAKTNALQQANESLRVANESLLHLSEEDALTGVANRRKFDQVVSSEFKRARRTSGALSLLMIDIDHFKDVNDVWGHQKGDLYLAWVVQILKPLVQRDADLVARYGGEEFAVLLPGAECDAAQLLAETVRAAVVAAQIPHPVAKFGGIVTVSIGISSLMQPFSEDGSAGALIAAADHALYQAKLQGRNCIVVEPLVHRQSDATFSVPDSLAIANTFTGVRLS